MPKNLTPAMRAHLDEETTRLAVIWRITRKDGAQFFFTDHDRDIVFGGEVYRADAGFARTAIRSDAGFAVDNLDLVGVFAEGGIVEDEVRAGLFDGAEIRIPFVNWEDPDGHGEIRLRRGTLAVIACSGERKTSADRRFAAAARRWEAERSEAMEPEMAAARAAIDAHAAERDGIIAKIRRAAGKASEMDLAALRARLGELEATRLSPVIPPCLFREDASPEALAQGLAFGWPSSSVWSDEGGLVVGGHGMSEDSALRYLALLNRLWDGLEFRRDRTTTQSFVVQGRRLTCSLMTQELVLARLMAARGGAARGIGCLARFLLAWPISTMGMRRYREADLSAPALASFDERMHELLDIPLPIDRPALTLRPQTLFLSQVARRQWIAFHDDVEQELGRNGAYGDVCDFAAKAAEKAARIAAVLHVFEHGPCGEIQADALLAGAQIAAWHLHEARRIMAACERPQLLSDADLLLQWLVQQEPQPVSLKRVSQYAPSRVRPKQRCDRAIEELQERHLAVLDRFEGTAVLRLNPRLRGRP